jgi:hypothetical protein
VCFSEAIGGSCTSAEQTHTHMHSRYYSACLFRTHMYVYSDTMLSGGPQCTCVYVCCPPSQHRPPGTHKQFAAKAFLVHLMDSNALQAQHASLSCMQPVASHHLGVTYEVGKQAAVNRVGTALHARVQVCTYDQSKKFHTPGSLQHRQYGHDRPSSDTRVKEAQAAASVPRQAKQPDRRWTAVLLSSHATGRKADPFKPLRATGQILPVVSP